MLSNCATCYALIGLSIPLTRLVQSWHLPLQLQELPSSNPSLPCPCTSAPGANPDDTQAPESALSVSYYPQRIVLSRSTRVARTTVHTPNRRRRTTNTYLLHDFLSEDPDHRMLTVDSVENHNMRRRRRHRVALRRLVRSSVMRLRGPS